MKKYNYEKDNAWVRIVCAACKHSSGLIVCGARHFDRIMNAQIKATGIKKWASAEQGFIDQFGNFYNRVEALQIIARNELQTINMQSNGSSTELYSEGLY